MRVQATRGAPRCHHATLTPSAHLGCSPACPWTDKRGRWGRGAARSAAPRPCARLHWLGHGVSAAGCPRGASPPFTTLLQTCLIHWQRTQPCGQPSLLTQHLGAGAPRPHLKPPALPGPRTPPALDTGHGQPPRTPRRAAKMLGQQTTPLLGLLRKLEAQNIWRMSYNILGQQQQQFSAAAAVTPAAGAAAARKPAGCGGVAACTGPATRRRHFLALTWSASCWVLLPAPPAAAPGAAPVAVPSTTPTAWQAPAPAPPQSRQQSGLTTPPCRPRRQSRSLCTRSSRPAPSVSPGGGCCSRGAGILARFAAAARNRV